MRRKIGNNKIQVNKDLKIPVFRKGQGWGVSSVIDFQNEFGTNGVYKKINEKSSLSPDTLVLIYDKSLGARKEKISNLFNYLNSYIKVIDNSLGEGMSNIFDVLHFNTPDVIINTTPKTNGTLFNGTSTYVSYDTGSSSDAFFGQLTIRARVIVNSSGLGTRVIWSHGTSSYRVFIDTNNQLFINSTGTGVVLTDDILLDIAVDFNSSGEGTQLRIDGVSEWTGTATAGSTSTETEFTVGCRLSTGSPGAYFDGYISDVEIPGYLRWRGDNTNDWKDVGIVYSVTNAIENKLPRSKNTTRDLGYSGIGIHRSGGFIYGTDYGLDEWPPVSTQNTGIVVTTETNPSKKITEYTISSLLSVNPGVQDISRTDKGTWLVVEGTNNIIRELSRDFKTVINTIDFDSINVNGVAAYKNNLWVLATNGTLRLSDDKGNILETYTLQDLSNTYDHLTINNGILWLSVGPVVGENSGFIIPFHLNRKAFGKSVPLTIQQETEEYIEGITFSNDGNTLFVCVDAGLKTGTLNNAIWSHSFLKTKGNRNAIFTE